MFIIAISFKKQHCCIFLGNIFAIFRLFINVGRNFTNALEFIRRSGGDMAKLLRLEAVQAKIGGLCRTTIWKLEKDGLFPKRRALTKKIVGWDESEIDVWIQSRDQKVRIHTERPK